MADQKQAQGCTVSGWFALGLCFLKTLKRPQSKTLLKRKQRKMAGSVIDGSNHHQEYGGQQQQQRQQDSVTNGTSMSALAVENPEISERSNDDKRSPELAAQRSDAVQTQSAMILDLVQNADTTNEKLQQQEGSANNHAATAAHPASSPTSSLKQKLVPADSELPSKKEDQIEIEGKKLKKSGDDSDVDQKAPASTEPGIQDKLCETITATFARTPTRNTPGAFCRSRTWWWPLRRDFVNGCYYHYNDWNR